MKKLTLTLFILIISIVQSQTMFKARVSAIKDGDTVVVINGLYTQITLRLAEVDCPEKPTIWHKSKRIYIRSNLQQRN